MGLEPMFFPVTGGNPLQLDRRTLCCYLTTHPDGVSNVPLVGLEPTAYARQANMLPIHHRGFVREEASVPITSLSPPRSGLCGNRTRFTFHAEESGSLSSTALKFSSGTRRLVMHTIYPEVSVELVGIEPTAFSLQKRIAPLAFSPFALAAGIEPAGWQVNSLLQLPIVAPLD